MKKIYLLALSCILFGSVTAQSLSNVESVDYDPVNNQYLASSDNSAIVAIAPDGTLSHFGSGTDASHGMEIFDGRLFAINGSQIRSYDLTTGNQLSSTTISGASFLNGMASNGIDSIWFTDFSSKDIFAMNVDNPSDYTKVASNIGVTPNGIVYDGANSRCLFVTWGTGTIRAMDLNTNTITTILGSTGLSNIDGIDYDSDGNWYVSSWSPGRITKYSNDFASSEIVPVTVVQPADICYATETDSLAIPGNGEVIFVGFTGSTVGIEEESFESFTIQYHYGFPVISFELMDEQTATFEILDMNGKVVAQILNGTQPKGKKKVNLSAMGLSSGVYVCQLQSKELSFSERIVIP
ncbi:MAG: T9SS type A sorting domain-containing protein [Flavobacteriales bacterium]